MAVLQIRLFGTVRVSHDGGSTDTPLSHREQSLLAWLLLNRRKAHAREALAAQFWCDQQESRARSCLSTALWRLRQVLEPRGIRRGTYLLSEPAAVGFNCTSDHWLDVAAFEDGVRHLPAQAATGGQSDCWSRAEAALTHYTGDLLEGFYDDWALRERERLRLLYLDSLGSLLRHHSESGALEEALRCGQQILALDPLREEIHREVIRLHVRSGHRALALRQYECCRRTLEEELGVEPMPETRRLCADLLDAASRVSRATRSSAVPSPIKPAPRTTRPGVAPFLRAAADRLEEARKAIVDAIRLVESDSDDS